MGSTIGCHLSSSCLTLLASLNFAAGGLGRALVIFGKLEMFSSFYQRKCSDLYRIFVRIDAYQSDMSQTRHRMVIQVALSPWLSQTGGSIPGVFCFLSGVCRFKTYVRCSAPFGFTTGCL